MPYIRQMIRGGNVIFFKKYHTYRYKNKKTPRGANINKTSETQQKINARRAAEKRIAKACTNFTPKNTALMRLSYYKGERPDGIDAAHSFLCSKFLKALKRKYPHLKYMGVTEVGSRGGIHHHLLIDKDVDLNWIYKHWHGGVDIRDTYTGELSQLASYFTKGECSDTIEETRKHTEQDKKYTASQNLEKPYVDEKVIKKSEHWTDAPRSLTIDGVIYDLKKGSDYSGVTKDGYEFQKYIMIARKVTKKTILSL